MLFKEFFRFLVFLIFLSIFSVLLVQLRLVDKAFLYADSGLEQSTIDRLNPKMGYWEEYRNFLSRLFSIEGGRTESGEPVYQHLILRLLPTFYLSLFSITFGVSFSIFLTIEFLTYPRMSSLLDSVSQIILSTPIFVFAILLLLVFFYSWGILPPGGFQSWDISYLILPGVSLGMRIYARLQLFISQSYKEESNSPYFILLKTRGLPRRIILYKHFLLKIFPTLIILIVLDLGSLLSGAMVVEEIFFFPGIGRSLFYSIKSMDGDLLQILILYSGIIFYTMNRIAMISQNKLLDIDKSV